MKILYTLLGRILFVATLPLIRVVIKRTERVYVNVSCNGEYVLIKNWLARDTWRLPGGGVRKNETSKEAARREVEEELGICLSVDDIMFVGESVATTDRLGFRFKIYSAHIASKKDIRIDNLEITDVMWTREIPFGQTAELDFLRTKIHSLRPGT